MTGLMLCLMLNATVVIPAGEAFVISGISKRSAADKQLQIQTKDL